jgi:uncharacterized protein YcbX
MHVAELWRYPVKGMRGESVAAVEVRADGVAGDRLVQVRNGNAQIVTGRTRPAVLGLSATLADEGEALVDGNPWRSGEAAEAVRRAAGDGARLVEAPQELRFDDTPLLVATDGMVESFGIDRRRLRPNLVIVGVAGPAEREWPGRRLRIGDVVIGVEHLCERCVITTFDPDTIEQDPDVLRRINSELEGLLALNCTVDQPGRVTVGDAVELV